MRYPKGRWAVLGLFILVITMVFLLPLGAVADEPLPLGAGMCINKVESLIQKGKITGSCHRS